jgi:predicted molibdopterin-dependent oxidoreductase YjgC
MALRYRTCPFCEATCGLEIETEGREVISVALLLVLEGQMG